MRVAGTFCLLMTTVLVLLTACSTPTVRQAPLPSETPVVFTFSDDHGSGGFEALHANNGLPMWQRQVVTFNQPPVMAGGVIYGLADAHPPSRPTVIAVRARDGNVLWRTPVPNWDSFASVAADSSSVALMTHSGGLYGLDPATGEQRWHIAGTGGLSLLVHHGVVYATLATSPHQARQRPWAVISPHLQPLQPHLHRRPQRHQAQVARHCHRAIPTSWRRDPAMALDCGKRPSTKMPGR